MSQRAAIREDTRQKGKPLLLLYILAETNGAEGPQIAEIAELMEICPRQVKRLIQQLEESGELKVTRGVGRGHSSVYTIPYLKVTRKGDIKGDAVKPLRGVANSKSPEIKGDKKGDTSAPEKGDAPGSGSPFPPGIKGDISEPPHTPHKDNYISQETGANAPGAERGAYIGRLLRFRREDLGVAQLPVEQGEAAAAKWMHGQGWPAEEVEACYLALKRMRWRGSAVTLITVKSQFPAWRKGELNDGEPKPQQQAGTRAERLRGRDYSVFRRGDGGPDAGDDTRPLPILAGVATPPRR